MMDHRLPTAVLTAAVLIVICSAAEPEDVRLVNGNSRCSGTVEMFHTQEWRRVKGDGWTRIEAAVVCRQLGCGSALEVTQGDFKTDYAERDVFFKCKGTESALSECRTSHEYGDYFSVESICSDSVRLVDGVGRCSGRVEVKPHQSWITICEADFDWQDAEVVCRELDCGPPVTLQGSLFGEGKLPLGTTEFQCKGTEDHLLNCNTSERKRTCTRAVGLTCSELRMVDRSSRCAGIVEMFHSGGWKRVVGLLSWKAGVVMCRQLDCGVELSADQRPEKEAGKLGVNVLCDGSESALSECRVLESSGFYTEAVCSDSVNLVDGVGLCSGRVEVKSPQSWTTVCEADFDWKDAEVVCRELDCGPPLTLQGALFGEGKFPFGSKVYHCEGTEDRLLNCSTSDRKHTCTGGKAVELTCSEARLVDGSSRCAGTVEIFQTKDWSRVRGSGWTRKEASLVCRQLDCGSVGAVMEKKSERPGQGVSVECDSQTSSLSKCTAFGPFQIETYAESICSDFVRLVDGAGLCSGRVEVRPHQSWTTICEADFDWQDAEVVCRELGCGSPLVLQGALFGEGKLPFGTREFQCKGTEDSLLTCSTSERRHTCTRGKAVGLTCSEVRLVDGNSRCAGTVEMFYNGHWKKVAEPIWIGTVATLVCRQLDCGSAVADIDRETESGRSEQLVGVDCDGSESALSDCRTWNVDGISNAVFVCSGLLERPTISLSTPVSVSMDLQRSEVFRGHSFNITCSTQPQYPGGSFHLKLPRNNRSHSQSAANHSASFYFPAADDSHQGDYSCVYENQVAFKATEHIIHNFSSQSEPLSLIITGVPLSAVITRMLLVPLLLLVTCLSIFVIFKKWGHILISETSGQQGAAKAAVQHVNLELVSQRSRAEEEQNVERGAGEELLTDLEQNRS